MTRRAVGRKPRPPAAGATVGRGGGRLRGKRRYAGSVIDWFEDDQPTLHTGEWVDQGDQFATEWPGSAAVVVGHPVASEWPVVWGDWVDDGEPITSEIPVIWDDWVDDGEPITSEIPVVSDHWVDDGEPIDIQTPAVQNATAGQPTGKARRFAGLDGLRALAVVAVLMYHGLPGLPNAGFVGVDVFFVLSGFLITSLIMDQADRHQFNVARFWDKRLRRIVPAVVVLLLGVSVVALWLERDTLFGFRRQVVGAVTFSFNWLDIASSSSYFSGFQPELLRNLWSLAVEMQFYLLWPLLLIPLLRWLGRPGTVITTVLLTVLSVALMVMLFNSDGDPTRVYFGTDTHAFGLLIGAGLACIVAGAARWRMRGATTVGRGLNIGLTVAGVASLAGIVWLIVAFDDSQPFVYPWGLLSASGLAGVAVLAASAQGSWFGRWLDLSPLRWLGERSYGVYLWHWPLGVMAATLVPVTWFGGDSSNWRDAFTMVVSFAVSIGAAAASYRWVEQPIRRDGWLALARRLTRLVPWRFALVTTASLLSAVALVACLVVAPVKSEGEVIVEQGQTSVDNPDGDDAGDDDSVDLPPPIFGPPVPPNLPPAALPMPVGKDILAIGDSVMLGCAPVLQQQFPGISIDAQVSRSFGRGLAIVEALKQQDKLRPVLLFGLMTNGPVSTDSMQHLVDLVGPDVTIVLINGHAARSWIKPTNDRAIAFAGAHPDDVLLVDWNSAINPHPKWLASDGVHPNQDGRNLYVQTIVAAMQKKYSG